MATRKRENEGEGNVEGRERVRKLGNKETGKRRRGGVEWVRERARKLGNKKILVDVKKSRQ